MGRAITPPAFSDPSQIADINALRRECTARFEIAVKRTKTSCKSLFEQLEEWGDPSVWKRLSPTWEEFCYQFTGYHNDELKKAADGLKILGYDASFEKLMDEHELWKGRHDAGESFRSIAKDSGVAPNTVRNRVCNKPSVHTKDCTPKRKVIQYKISQYTKPETAAVKIRDTFGDEFADALAVCLQ